MVRGLIETAPIAVESAPAPEIEVLPEPLRPAKRIGVFGGTFDPPHIGHLVLATAAADQLSLDRVVFIPAGIPPHKRNSPRSSGTDRLLLTRLAIAGEASFELNPIEIERTGVSYTVETVESLVDIYGEETDLVLIMASDSFASIDTWRDPDRLLELAEWAVGPRPGWPLPTREELASRWGPRHSRIHLLDAPPIGISSSEVRARIAAGRPIRYLVPRAVEDEIVLRSLYRSPRS